jgi:hypothetical protein
MFLGAFAIRKAAICSVMSVYPSVHPPTSNNAAPTGRIFVMFGIGGFFEMLSRKFRVSLISDKSSGYFTCRRMYICDNISLNSS